MKGVGTVTTIIHISVGTVAIAAVAMAGMWLFRREIRNLLSAIALVFMRK